MNSDHITLKNMKWVSLPGVAEREHLDDALHGALLLQRWGGGTGALLPTPFLKESYRLLHDWWGSLLKHKTRAGFEVPMDR